MPEKIDRRMNKSERFIVLVAFCLLDMLRNHRGDVQDLLRSAEAFRIYSCGVGCINKAFNMIAEILPQEDNDKLARMIHSYEIELKPTTVNGDKHACIAIPNESVDEMVKTIVEESDCAYCIKDRWKSCKLYHALCDARPPKDTKGCVSCPYAGKGKKQDDFIDL